MKRVLDFPTTDQLKVADLPEGIYFLRLVTDDRTYIKKESIKIWKQVGNPEEDEPYE